MAQLKLNKVNIVDITVITVVVLIIAIGGIYYLFTPEPVNTRLRVTFHIGDQVISKAIVDQAKIDKTVYLNSVNSPLDVVVVKENIDKTGELSSLDIILEGPGYVDAKGNYVFNGQRILVNQKSEIHGNYFAPGAAIKIENAN